MSVMSVNLVIKYLHDMTDDIEASWNTRTMHPFDSSHSSIQFSW